MIQIPNNSFFVHAEQEKYTSIRMLKAALFLLAKTANQPKC